MDDWKFQPARDLGLSPADRLKSLRRESGLIDTLLHHVWWCFVRCYLKIYHRFSVRGRENLPTEAPFLIVANHASHLDVLALAGSCPARLRDRIFPIAAGGTFFDGVPGGGFSGYALNCPPPRRQTSDPADLSRFP